MHPDIILAREPNPATFFGGPFLRTLWQSAYALGFIASGVNEKLGRSFAIARYAVGGVEVLPLPLHVSLNAIYRSKMDDVPIPRAKA